MKTLHNSDVSGARQNVKDIKIVGNGDMFRLLCKASSENEGWMKSTKACEVNGDGMHDNNIVTIGSMEIMFRFA